MFIIKTKLLKCRTFYYFFFLLNLMTIQLLNTPSVTATTPLFERERITGNWKGSRDAMEEKGLTIDLALTNEVDFINSGITKKTHTLYLKNVDLTFTFNTQKSGWWDGGTFFAYFLSNSGADPTEYVGDLQATSNIEANNSSRLYEFWYNHDFFDGSASGLIGLYDLNSEFNGTEYGGLFFNSSFGIEPDISANVPVSIFNVAAPAIRLQWAPVSWLNLLAGIFDGDPGSADDNDNGLNITIDEKKEGRMLIFESQFQIGQEKNASFSLPGTYKLGIWEHSGSFNNFLDSNSSGGILGYYLLVDQMVYREKEEQGLAFFFQLGKSDKKRSLVDYYFGAGLNYVGLIPHRDADIFGIAYGNAHISDDFVESTGSGQTKETVIEITYQMQILNWLMIQPDFQIVNNPNADPAIDTSTVFAVRFETVF